MKEESKKILNELANKLIDANNDELTNILDILVHKFNRSYFNTLKNNQNFNRLKNYIIEKTQFLNEYFYKENIELKLSTRCFYVLTKLTDILHCANSKCGKPIIRNFNPCIEFQLIVYCGDNPYCSQTDERTIKKALASKLRNNGTYLNVDKAKQTRIERYGKYTPDTQIIKSKLTKLKNHGDPHYCNHIKANNTKLAKYGSKNNINKIKKTMLERYGVEYSAQNYDSYIKSKRKYIYKII